MTFTHLPMRMLYFSICSVLLFISAIYPRSFRDCAYAEDDEAFFSLAAEALRKNPWLTESSMQIDLVSTLRYREGVDPSEDEYRYPTIEGRHTAIQYKRQADNFQLVWHHETDPEPVYEFRGADKTAVYDGTQLSYLDRSKQRQTLPWDVLGMKVMEHNYAIGGFVESVDYYQKRIESGEYTVKGNITDDLWEFEITYARNPKVHVRVTFDPAMNFNITSIHYDRNHSIVFSYEEELTYAEVDGEWIPVKLTYSGVNERREAEYTATFSEVKTGSGSVGPDDFEPLKNITLPIGMKVVDYRISPPLEFTNGFSDRSDSLMSLASLLDAPKSASMDAFVRAGETKVGQRSLSSKFPPQLETGETVSPRSRIRTMSIVLSVIVLVLGTGLAYAKLRSNWRTR